ncbi:MAG: hypothetical protein ACPGJS_03300 [Flammeovirgaceae bacterium]
MSKKIAYFVIAGCLLIATSCSKPDAKTSLQPRSTLSDIDVGKRYEKQPKRHRNKKNKAKIASGRNEFAEARRKELHKQAREAGKPQYANPMYFGHKKKPKKRKKGKRKFCKECGIVH